MRRMLLLPFLAACAPEAERAPRVEAGLCSQAVPGNLAPVVVERGVPNIETCAARLEVVRQQGGGDPVEGRYGPVRLYVSEAAVEAAQSADGRRYAVFQPEALAQLQAATRDRIAAESRPRRTGPPVGEGLPPAPAP